MGAFGAAAGGGGEEICFGRGLVGVVVGVVVILVLGLVVEPGVFEGGGADGAAIVLGDHGPEVDTVDVVDAVEAGYVDGGLLVVVVGDVSHVFGDEAEGLGGLGDAVGIRDGFGEDGDVALRGGGHSVCCCCCCCCCGGRAVSIGVGGEAEGWESSLLEIIADLFGWRGGGMFGGGERG